MNCFYHPTDSAVGICKSCQKALCMTCAVDLGKGLACKSRCEEDVRRLIEIVETSVRYSPASRSIVAASRRSGMIQSTLAALMGVVFLWWGLRSGEGMMFVAVMGAVFLIYGLVQFYRMSRLVPPADDGNPGGRAT